MQKIITLSVFLFSLANVSGQNLTGKELLQKSIEYHDPQGKWPVFKGGLHLVETRPDASDRKTHLHLNNKTAYFELIQHRDENELVHVLENGECFQLLNKSRDISGEDREQHELNCDRTYLLRNYYLYLWGLPMKLKDTGTQVHDEVGNTEFQGKQVLSLKVTYDKAVGKDTWYFYFNPDNYALVGYRFFHDETKNDGEYITLEGEKTIKGIRFPKNRKWFTNQDEKFLGEDILE